MKRTKLAARYAKALFEFAEELQKVDVISKDIELIDETFKSNEDLCFALLSPVVRTDKKISIMNGIFKDKVDDVTLRYLTLILKKGRELQINTICSEYVKIYKASKNIITLEVYSAYPLEEETLSKLREKVAGETKANIELEEHIKPDLIGGVMIKYGDYLVDASVKHSIDLLKKQLTDKTYQVNF